jgi:hypothetical protein
MNGQPETPELEVNPSLTLYHLRTWSRTDARTKTTHSVPLVQFLCWPIHDIARVNNIT